MHFVGMTGGVRTRSPCQLTPAYRARIAGTCERQLQRYELVLLNTGIRFSLGEAPPTPGGPSIAVDGLGSSIQGWQGARAHPKARETFWTSHYGRGIHVGRNMLSMQLAGSTRRDGYGPAVSYGSGYGSPVVDTGSPC